MYKLLLLFIISLQASYALNLDLKENQEIYINEDRVTLTVEGEAIFSNSTSPIYDITIDQDSPFLVNSQYNKINMTNFNYTITTTISKALYNQYLLEAKTFLEYTSKFDIQTNRIATLTKYNRYSNETFSPRRVKIALTNPTNYLQTYYITLIKTKPNQINDFRNQLYLKTKQELLLEPNSSQIYNYTDQLSEIGDSYFLEYEVITHPNITRTIEKYQPSESKTTSGGSSFSLITKDIIVDKTLSPILYTKDEPITITILLSNPNPYTVSSIELYDTIPEDFYIQNNPELREFTQIIDLLPFETKEITYSLIYRGDQNSSILPGIRIEQGSKTIESPPLQLYQKTSNSNPQLLIQKTITPLTNTTYIIEITIENIGSQKSDDFTLYENNNSYYIPALPSNQIYEIIYETENLDINDPSISKEIPYTTSLILNEKLSTTHSSKSNQSYYTLALIGLAAILLISDIVL